MRKRVPQARKGRGMSRKKGDDPRHTGNSPGRGTRNIGREHTKQTSRQTKWDTPMTLALDPSVGREGVENE